MSNNRTKYHFIINPVSGKGKGPENFRHKLENYRKHDDRDIILHTTNGALDALDTAAAITRECMETNTPAVIFACGGDGTLNEVANGIADFYYDNTESISNIQPGQADSEGAGRGKSVALGLVPVGSGNDFARYFDRTGDFTDIDKLLKGYVTSTDLLRLTWDEMDESEGKVVHRHRYCINGMNLGLDGNTAILAGELRKYPVIRGSMSYILALGINTAGMNGADVDIIADGETFYSGKLLLSTVSNGRFCGGGVESCPKAKIDDGLAEVLVIPQVRRRTLFRLFPDYKNGKLMDRKDFDSLAKYRRAEKITLIPRKGYMEFVADGEILKTGKLDIEVMPGMIPLFLPSK